MDEDGKKKAICNKCNLQLSYSTSVAKKHLKMHNDLLKQYMEMEIDWDKKKGGKGSKKRKLEEGQLTIAEAYRNVDKYGSKNERFLTKYIIELNNNRKIAIDDALGFYLSMPTISINSATHPLFLNFIKALNPKYEV